MRIHQAQAKNFCRVLDIRVPQIVDSDTLYPCGLGASVHLMMEIAFGYGENAVLLFYPIEHSQIVLHFLAEKLRHLDVTIAFLGFRTGNHILAVKPLIGLVDPHSAVLKVKIRRSQG